MDKKPKWQKAVIEIDDPNLQLKGREVWVETGKPELQVGYNSDLAERAAVGHLTNVVNFLGDRMLIPSNGLEFLARGPEDFADTVEMIPYSSWSQR